MTTATSEKSEPRELSRDSFVVNGDAEGTFRYPFRTGRGEGSMATYERPKLGSPLGFELSDTTKEKIFVRPGFDMQEAVSRSEGAIVEIAGPTVGGYETLTDINLPDKPVITNVASAMQHASYGMTELDRLTIDVMADGRELPFRDESVGVLMVSCLVRLDGEGLDYLSDEEYEAEVGRVYASATKTARENETPAELSRNEIEASPRIGLWHEADRLVEDGGLFVIKGVSEEDIRLAAALGFEIVAHSPVYKMRRSLHIPHEMVFRRASGEVKEDPIDLSTLKRRRLGSSVIKKLGLRK